MSFIGRIIGSINFLTRPKVLKAWGKLVLIHYCNLKKNQEYIDGNRTILTVKINYLNQSSEFSLSHVTLLFRSLYIHVHMRTSLRYNPSLFSSNKK